MSFYLIIETVLNTVLQSAHYETKYESGQGLVEYALILVLVAVAVVAVLTVFGPQLGGLFSEVNSSIPT